MAAARRHPRRSPSPPPPLFPEPTPVGTVPNDAPEEPPLPEESVAPEDDDDVMAMVSRPAGATDAAPETADGLEELQAQLRQLRWAHPAATA